ncbi:cytochrome P450 [Phellopilus nigrolimitatus]|nr:cytochrome P450 [Phellopilus nigrolimitatus]
MYKDDVLLNDLSSPDPGMMYMYTVAAELSLVLGTIFYILQPALRVSSAAFSLFTLDYVITIGVFAIYLFFYNYMSYSGTSPGGSLPSLLTSYLHYSITIRDRPDRPTPSMSLLRTLSAAGAVSLAFLLFKLVRLSRRLSNIPGPKSPSILFGNVLDLETARVGTRYNVWAKKYGLTFKIRGPLSEPWLILADPKGVNYILNSGSALYPRPEDDRIILETMFGRGMFCSDGEEHKRLRRGINHAFSPQSIDEVSDVLFDLANKLKNEWEAEIDKTESNSTILNVSKSAAVFALDAITMTMFNYNCSASDSSVPAIVAKISNPGGDMISILLGILASMFPWLVKLPSPIMTLFKEMRNELAKVVDRAQTSAETEGLHAKVLDVLELSGSLTDPARKKEAVAQMIEIVFAGSETSANVMTECLYELSRKPAIQEKLRKELVSYENEHGRTPTYRDLTNCLMRLGSDRSDVRRDSFVTVQPGQVIRIPVRDGINSSDAIWGASAAEFLPERWLNEKGLPDIARDIHAPGNILTFGDGPKVCLGRLFALAELKIVTSILVRNFVFETDGNEIDFFHIGGNTVKPAVRGKESEGVQLASACKESVVTEQAYIALRIIIRKASCEVLLC